MIEYITSLKPLEILIGFGSAIVAIVILLLTITFVLDKLNVKTVSFTKGFTFYEDGETKKKRVYQRKPRVAKRKTRK